jgi:chromosome condensin MukBEF MukE localization factor
MVRMLVGSVLCHIMIESIEIAQKGVSSNDGGKNRPSLCSKVPLGR